MKNRRLLLTIGGMGLVVIMMLASAVSDTHPASPATGKIVFGVNTIMSGPPAPWGLQFPRTGQIAAEQINAQGGLEIGGKRYMISVVSYDHGGDPGRSVENTKRLVEDDKANFLCIWLGACVLANADYITQRKIPTIAVSAGAADVNPKWPYLIKLIQDAKTGPYAQLKYAAEFGIKTAGLILPDNASGHAEGDSYLSVAKDAGVQIQSVEYYKPGTTDFYPILTRLKAANVGAISTGNTPPGDNLVVMKQAVELGFTGRIITLAKNTPEDILAAVGPKAIGQIALLYHPTPDTPASYTAEEKELINAVIQRWGKNGKLVDIFASDICEMGRWPYLWIWAMKKANSLDPDKIMSVLRTGEVTVQGRTFRFVGTQTYGLAAFPGDDYWMCTVNPDGTVQPAKKYPVISK